MKMFVLYRINCVMLNLYGKPLLDLLMGGLAPETFDIRTHLILNFPEAQKLYTSNYLFS